MERIKKILGSREKIVSYLLAAVIVYLGTYRLGDLTMPIILDDEFGYWSNSMLFTGQDWTSLTGNINYYSYGYSLVLCIVRKVADLRGYGWAELYKTAVVFNVLFVVAGYFLAIRIAKRYMKHMNGIMIAAVCFVAVIYPSNMLYTHVTLTECTLTFFVLAVCVYDDAGHRRARRRQSCRLGVSGNIHVFCASENAGTYNNGYYCGDCTAAAADKQPEAFFGISRQRIYFLCNA